ncbi:MAG: PD40 domain-containing protein [Actinobacteria bacterium]|nr:PD40 domain-containing protein [Actinomycetota bacterium]
MNRFNTGGQWRAFIVPTAAAAAIALVAGGSIATGATQKPKPPSQAAVAQKLASTIMKARTAGARYKALLSVMRTLHARVLTPKGKALVPGGRGFPRGLYLFDFELRGMAAALGRGDTVSLSELATLLTDAGVKPGGRDLSPEELRQVLLAGVRKAAASPRAPSSVVPLLARELGRLHASPYDMLRNVPADSLRLDPLQSFLFVTDVAVAAVKGGKVQPGLRRPSLVHAPSAAASRCAGEASNAAEDIAFGKWTLTIVNKLGAQVKLVAIIIDAIHGPALAFSVKVTAASPQLQETHYGPAGHAANAGQVLRFRVKVEMLDAYPDFVIECGALIGMKFPKKGPIPGVSVFWEQAEASLEKHGKITHEPADAKTGADGIATLVFTPKGEKIVGFGLEKDARGVLNGLAAYQSAFGNVPGALVQFLVPKYAGMAWHVLFHKARGFKFPTVSFSSQREDESCNYVGGTCTIRISLSGHTCGDDPYAQQWEGHQSVISNEPGGSSELDWVADVDHDDVVYTMRWVPGPPPKIRFTFAIPGWSPTSPTTVTVDVVEDTSCPDNSGAGAAGSPVFPSGGGKIAFVRGNFVYVIDSNGRNVERLTRGGNPAWSPDGTKLAFQRRDGIYVAAADGTGVRRVIDSTDPEFPAYDPAWSPDGMRIAYAGRPDVPEGDYPAWTGLRVATLDGKSRALTDPGVPAGDLEPAWSPGGATIAFVRSEFVVHDVYDNRVYVIRPAGKTEKRIAAGRSPAWSPDGRRLAFVAVVHRKLEVVTTTAAGKDRRVLTHGGEKVHVAWSPDGRSLVFSRKPGEQGGIYKIGVDGKGLRRLTAIGSAADWQLLPK